MVNINFKQYKEITREILSQLASAFPKRTTLVLSKRTNLSDEETGTLDFLIAEGVIRIFKSDGITEFQLTAKGIEALTKTDPIELLCVI